MASAQTQSMSFIIWNILPRVHKISYKVYTIQGHILISQFGQQVIMDCTNRSISPFLCVNTPPSPPHQVTMLNNKSTIYPVSALWTQNGLQINFHLAQRWERWRKKNWIQGMYKASLGKLNERSVHFRSRMQGEESAARCKISTVNSVLLFFIAEHCYYLGGKTQKY